MDISGVMDIFNLFDGMQGLTVNMEGLELLGIVDRNTSL